MELKWYCGIARKSLSKRCVCVCNEEVAVHGCHAMAEEESALGKSLWVMIGNRHYHLISYDSLVGCWLLGKWSIIIQLHLTMGTTIYSLLPPTIVKSSNADHRSDLQLVDVN